jgi:glycosyltransferase involved in cell wall biosynthesis
MTCRPPSTGRTRPSAACDARADLLRRESPGGGGRGDGGLLCRVRVSGRVRGLLRGAHRGVCPAAGQARGHGAGTRHGRMRDRSVVVPLGADVETFGPWQRSEEVRRSIVARLGGERISKLVLAVGRLSAEKGVDLLLPAIRLAVDPGWDVRLVVAGDGPMREAMARDALEFLPGHSLFLGHVAGETSWPRSWPALMPSCTRIPESRSVLRLARDAGLRCASGAAPQRWGVVLRHR